ncbi:sigma-54-dependent Fis family transcriptional regulator [Candidatus Sumerlaeota bacterium]|nr:sigma-54-dependent Fis family transcriptional regulator [Candidatus Sumerlaeota bacterium]
MKSEDLHIDELIDFSEGWLSLKGRRLMIQDIHAFSQMKKDLMEFLGEDRMRRLLTRFGYFWGQADAAAMKRIFNWDDKQEWLKAGPKLLTIQGVSRITVPAFEWNEETGEFYMETIAYNSMEAEEYQKNFGSTDHPVCWMLAAYLGGYASFCFGGEIFFIEEKCQATGDRVCKFTGKNKKDWGDVIESHLPYLEAENIHDQIMQLTSELKKKQKQIEAQRKKLASIYPKQEKEFLFVRSRSFHQVMDLAHKVAHFDSTILITGESGVGKEVLARYIHSLSHRASGPFLAINCGALPDTLLESELFGHTRGAFTGAVRERIGLFEETRKGAIFLDEIGDISPAMQIKLLRVLQEREILRLGENKPRKIDVRIMAATNKNLQKEISEENFREDLYYRLAVVEIFIPPLRERKDDILPMARYFIKKLAKNLKIANLRLDASTLDILQEYTWPGNIRQLENALERAAVVCRNGVILPENLPANISRYSDPTQGIYSLESSLEQVERQHIKNILAHTGGNRTKAAQVLGISAATLWRKMKEMGESHQNEK